MRRSRRCSIRPDSPRTSGSRCERTRRDRGCRSWLACKGRSASGAENTNGGAPAARYRTTKQPSPIARPLGEPGRCTLLRRAHAHPGRPGSPHLDHRSAPGRLARDAIRVTRGAHVRAGQARSCHGGERWERDLDADLEVLVSERIRTIACLVEAHELVAWDLERLPAAAAARGMELLHRPIRDVSVPTLEEARAAWSTSSSRGAMRRS